ncbi:tetratricopeptide repeat protein [Allocoleopsis sp.]|uniref:tetratricopeptide repeat protein n=1 Tax=Allocoleopsis sp. TaxID=3088169 RepID=UPI002FD69C15
MLKDAQGLEVTTDSPEAIAAINRFIDQILSMGNNPEVIFKAVEADTTSVIANAYAATLHMLAETADGPTQAAPYLKRAYEYCDSANEREQLYLHSINAWVKGDIDQAIAYQEEIANKYPPDLLNVQLGQKHYLDLGNKQGLLQIVEKVLPANRDNHYIYGMLAFGLEENQRYQEAEAAGRKANEMNRCHPWAHHAIAHVLYSQGRLDEGIAWTESVCDVWENSSFYTHNWWHTALYYVDKEDFIKVLELYDTRIWGTTANKKTALDLINAISLLIQLEMAGVDVSYFHEDSDAADAPGKSIASRWEEVANSVTGHIHEHILGLYDLHYIYALARVGRDEWVEQMLKSLQSYAQTAKPCVQKAWSEVILPAAQGMVAYAKGEWATAAAFFKLALPRLHAVGGSDAQRDLFEQIYLDCLIRTKENEQARQLLEKRAAVRDHVPSIQRELARISSH